MRTASSVKTASAPDLRKFAASIVDVGSDVSSLTYEGSGKPISQSDREKLEQEIADELGSSVELVRTATKSGSVDALLQMTQTIENLRKTIKDK